MRAREREGVPVERLAELEVDIEAVAQQRRRRRRPGGVGEDLARRLAVAARARERRGPARHGVAERRRPELVAQVGELGRDLAAAAARGVAQAAERRRRAARVHAGRDEALLGSRRGVAAHLVEARRRLEQRRAHGVARAEGRLLERARHLGRRPAQERELRLGERARRTVGDRGERGRAHEPTLEAAPPRQGPLAVERGVDLTLLGIARERAEPAPGLVRAFGVAGALPETGARAPYLDRLRRERERVVDEAQRHVTVAEPLGDARRRHRELEAPRGLVVPHERELVEEETAEIAPVLVVEPRRLDDLGHRHERPQAGLPDLGRHLGQRRKERRGALDGWRRRRAMNLRGARGEQLDLLDLDRGDRRRIALGVRRPVPELAQVVGDGNDRRVLEARQHGRVLGRHGVVARRRPAALVVAVARVGHQRCPPPSRSTSRRSAG